MVLYRTIKILNKMGKGQGDIGNAIKAMWICLICIGIVLLGVTVTLYTIGGIRLNQENQEIYASNGERRNCTVLSVQDIPDYCLSHSCDSSYTYTLTYNYTSITYSQQIPFGVKNLNPFVLEQNDSIYCWCQYFDYPGQPVVVYQVFSHSGGTIAFIAVASVIAMLLIVYMFYLCRFFCGN